MKHPVKVEKKQEYLLVDGYNIIFAWNELKQLAHETLDGARDRLVEILQEYQALYEGRILLVFDAYRVKGRCANKTYVGNLEVVFTGEEETADRYIERFSFLNRQQYQIVVATSDGLEQIIIRGQNCRILSALDLKQQIQTARENCMSGIKTTES